MRNETNKNPNIDLNKATLDKLQNLLSGKKVLYIATTYLEYIRIQQEVKITEKYSSQVNLIVSNSKYYLIRVLYVYIKTVFFFKKVDVVFIGFAPQLVLPFLKWRFSKKLIIIDFFISLYDTFVFDRKKFSANSKIGKTLKFFDKLTLKQADLVISDTNSHAQFFISELECKANKIKTLYLEADRKFYFPKNANKPSLLKDKFVVLYFGSVLPLQGTQIILEAINQCKNNNIYFIMVGPLDSQLCQNKNVAFYKWLEQEELSNYIALSDLCLAGHFNKEIDKAKRTIPGKAYIYEAMEKPMILGNNEANRERYPKVYSKIKFVDMGNAKALTKIIEKSFSEKNHEKK